MILTLMAFILFLPMLSVITHSFMSNQELAYMGESPIKLLDFIPNRVTFSHYIKILLHSPKYLRMFLISVVLTVSVVVGQGIVAVLGGYVLAKGVFKGKNMLFMVYVMLMLLPYQVTLVPQYMMLERLGMNGKIGAVILVSIFSPFGVFLMTQFMRSIPESFFEVAYLEGASQIQILTNIILPLSKSGISALAILTMIDCWNMIEQPLLFIKNTLDYPLSLGLLMSGIEMGTSFAGSSFFMIPILLLYLYFNEDLIEGIGHSCLKE